MLTSPPLLVISTSSPLTSPLEVIPFSPEFWILLSSVPITLPSIFIPPSLFGESWSILVTSREIYGLSSVFLGVTIS